MCGHPVLAPEFPERRLGLQHLRLDIQRLPLVLLHHTAAWVQSQDRRKLVHWDWRNGMWHVRQDRSQLESLLLPAWVSYRIPQLRDNHFSNCLLRRMGPKHIQELDRLLLVCCFFPFIVRTKTLSIRLDACLRRLHDFSDDLRCDGLRSYACFEKRHKVSRNRLHKF